MGLGGECASSVGSSSTICVKASESIDAERDSDCDSLSTRKLVLGELVVSASSLAAICGGWGWVSVGTLVVVVCSLIFSSV